MPTAAIKINANPTRPRGRAEALQNNKSLRIQKHQSSRKVKSSSTEFSSPDPENNLAVSFKRESSSSSQQTSTSSEAEKHLEKKTQIQSKTKSKTKQVKKQNRSGKKKKHSKSQSEKIEAETPCKSEIKAECDSDNDLVCDSSNDTLRWDNICSDSEEESERLKLYKENRRKRYIDALEVKIINNKICTKPK